MERRAGEMIEKFADENMADESQKAFRDEMGCVFVVITKETYILKVFCVPKIIFLPIYFIVIYNMFVKFQRSCSTGDGYKCRFF